VTAVARLLGNRWTVLLCQIALALVFLAAALSKIGDSGMFARQIHYYRLVPFGLENLLAITLPWIELVVALAILLRVNPRAGAATGAGLMALFVVVVAAAVARGLDIECGCFGTADAGRVGLAKLMENLGLLAMAVVGCIQPRESDRA
jgi:uncharacterized membrane protein YphA (DoxX/SURF4 family)